MIKKRFLSPTAPVSIFTQLVDIKALLWLTELTLLGASFPSRALRPRDLQTLNHKERNWERRFSAFGCVWGIITLSGTEKQTKREKASERTMHVRLIKINFGNSKLCPEKPTLTQKLMMWNYVRLNARFSQLHLMIVVSMSSIKHFAQIIALGHINATCQANVQTTRSFEGNLKKTS